MFVNSNDECVTDHRMQFSSVLLLGKNVSSETISLTSTGETHRRGNLQTHVHKRRRVCFVFAKRNMTLKRAWWSARNVFQRGGREMAEERNEVFQRRALLYGGSTHIGGELSRTSAKKFASEAEIRVDVTCELPAPKFFWKFVSIFTVCAEVRISCTFNFRSRGLISLLERELVQRSYLTWFLLQFLFFFFFFFVEKPTLCSTLLHDIEYNIDKYW